MRINRFTKILLFALWPTLGWCQMGETAYTFLNLPSSSHINALGGNNISIIEEDVSVAQQNPALLGNEMANQLSLNYMSYIAGINLLGANYAIAVGERGAMGFGIQYADFGKFTQAEADGSITGTFSPKDIVFSLLYSYDIADRLRGGIKTQLIYSAYEHYSAVALGVDLGINYYDPDNALSASLVLKNMGGSLKKFDQQEMPLPFDVQLGLSHTLAHAPLRLSVTAHHLTRWKLPYTSIGSNFSTSTSDFQIKDTFADNLFRHLIFGVDVMASNNLYFALGYNYKTRSDMRSYARNFISGFSIGAGLRIQQFAINISLAQHHVQSTSFMFNLAAIF